jgi:hypothetical protein
MRHSLTNFVAVEKMDILQKQRPITVIRKLGQRFTPAIVRPHGFLSFRNSFLFTSACVLAAVVQSDSVLSLKLDA